MIVWDVRVVPVMMDDGIPVVVPVLTAAVQQASQPAGLAQPAGLVLPAQPSQSSLVVNVAKEIALSDCDD